MQRNLREQTLIGEMTIAFRKIFPAGTTEPSSPKSQSPADVVDSDPPHFHLGDGSSKDIKLEPVLEAISVCSRVGDALGAFMAFSTKNDESNMLKLRRVLDTLSKKGNKIETVRDLLEAEINTGIHKPGGILADPSAAMSLLWLRRTVRFSAMFLDHAQQGHETSDFSRQVREVYSKCLEPFHGWLLRNTFMMAFATLPSRDECLRRLAPRIKQKNLRKEMCCSDIGECVPLMLRLVNHLESHFSELDLEDLRKS